MKMLSIQRPRPSMLMAISLAANSAVNFSLVNCDPWSLLKISGPASSQRTPQGLYAKVDFHRQRQRPTQHVPAEPVHHRHQVDEALRHPDIRDVRAPDLIDAPYRDPSQQVRVDLVPFAWLAQLRFGVHDLDSHHLHQTRDPLAIHWITLAHQPLSSFSGFRKTAPACTVRRSAA